MIGEKNPETDAFWKLVCEEKNIAAPDYHCLTSVSYTHLTLPTIYSV